MNRYDIARGVTIDPRPPKYSQEPPLPPLTVSEYQDPIIRSTIFRVSIPEIILQMGVSDYGFSREVNPMSKEYALAAIRQKVHEHVDSLFKPYIESEYKWRAPR